jgi:anti-sigma B factor antagonist
MSPMVRHGSPGGSLPLLTTELVAADGVATLFVRGEVDLSVGAELGAAIDGAIAAATSTVIVDLHDTAYIDSTGLHCLLAGRRVACDRALDFNVVRPSAPARRLLEVTGLTELLHPRPTTATLSA